MPRGLDEGDLPVMQDTSDPHGRFLTIQTSNKRSSEPMKAASKWRREMATESSAGQMPKMPCTRGGALPIRACTHKPTGKC